MLIKLYSNFYNKLISPLDKINEQIIAGDYQSAIIETIKMRNKIENQAWSPFPAYQSLLTKLQIDNHMEILSLSLQLLDKGQDYKTDALKKIATLKSLSHVFNMVDITYHDSERNNDIIFNYAVRNGLVRSRTITGDFDCKNNMRFFTDNEARPKEIPVNPDYIKLVELFNTLARSSRLETFCQNLFSTMDKIEKEDSIVAALKSDEENFYVLGNIEWAITISNSYKELFQPLDQQETFSDINIA